MGRITERWKEITTRFAGDTESTEGKNRKRSDQIGFDRTVCLVEGEERIHGRVFPKMHFD